MACVILSKIHTKKSKRLFFVNQSSAFLGEMSLLLTSIFPLSICNKRWKIRSSTSCMLHLNFPIIDTTSAEIRCILTILALYKVDNLVIRCILTIWILYKVDNLVQSPSRAFYTLLDKHANEQRVVNPQTVFL